MNWMSDMEDPLFKNLLSDYVSDTPDDGFADLVINQLHAKAEREARIRRVMLSGACLVGGVIAGLQVKNLLAWAGESTLLASASGSAVFPAIIGLTFMFSVWMSLESRPVSFGW